MMHRKLTHRSALSIVSYWNPFVLFVRTHEITGHDSSQFSISALENHRRPTYSKTINSHRMNRNQYKCTHSGQESGKRKAIARQKLLVAH